MKEYLYSITISVLVFAVFDLFITKTRNGKLAKSIISLIVTTMIAIPIVNLFTSSNSNSFNLNDGDFLAHLEEIEDKSQKSYVKSLLLKEGIEVIEIDIDREDNKIKKLIIVISSKSSHIDITKVVLETLKDLVDKGVEVIVETQWSYQDK